MPAPAKGQGNKIDPAKQDLTAALSDALLRRILLALPESARASWGLVCHRWLRVVGGLQLSLRVIDWSFLESGRLPKRFPNLTDIDLTRACIRDPSLGSSLILALPHLVLPLYPYVPSSEKPFSLEACLRSQQVQAEALDRGLAALASGCPDLQKLRVVDVSANHGTGASFSEWEFVSANEKSGQKAEKMFSNGEEQQQSEKIGEEGFRKLVTDSNAKPGILTDDAEVKAKAEIPADAPVKKAEGLTDAPVKQAAGGVHVRRESDSDGELGKKGINVKFSRQGEAGLVSLGRGCPLLQELEVHQCTDESVTAVVACQNVQILRLVGTVPGFARCSFTDVGLTILANKCRRLVKLDLSGCEASFAGIAAIGQCCLMLEELILSTTGFQDGWVAALSLFQNLKTLRLERCKYVDRRPGPTEHIEQCHTLERMQLVCCDLRDRVGFAALLTVCVNVRELEFQDCWGLDDDSFVLAAQCRKVRLLSLDGCSLVTAAGLETVTLACKDLQRLRVVYCGGIRDSEISADFGDVVVTLKEFRWRPDTKSLLSSTTAIAQTGRWFFKKA